MELDPGLCDECGKFKERTWRESKKKSSAKHKKLDPRKIPFDIIEQARSHEEDKKTGVL